MVRAVQAELVRCADTEAVGIREAESNEVIDTRDDIVFVLVAPSRKDHLAEGRAATRAAAVIDLYDDVTMGGEQLPFEVEAVLVVLAIGSQRLTLLRCGS